jgi:hypothetical protein
MKKLVIFAVFIAFIAGSLVFAQEDKHKHDSEYYYKNVTLEKIYPYDSGYVVQYRRGLNRLELAYLPLEWFTTTAGKGEIITLPRGQTWPSLTIYYKNGVFSHVRLYVHPQASHQTWGTIPQNANLDSRFENVEELWLKY